MTSQSLRLCCLALLAACAHPDDKSSDPGPLATATLMLDGAQPQTSEVRSAWEATVPASAGCASSVSLEADQGGGVRLWVLLPSREPGASAFPSPHATALDYEAPAGGAPGGTWTGTLTVVAWTPTWIELELSDGTVCTDGEASCTPSAGSYVLDGPRVVGAAENGSTGSGWFDAASGAELCRYADAI